MNNDDLYMKLADEVQSAENSLRVIDSMSKKLHEFLDAMNAELTKLKQQKSEIEKSVSNVAAVKSVSSEIDRIELPEFVLFNDTYDKFKIVNSNQNPTSAAVARSGGLQDDVESLQVESEVPGIVVPDADETLRVESEETSIVLPDAAETLPTASEESDAVVLDIPELQPVSGEEVADASVQDVAEIQKAEIENAVIADQSVIATQCIEVDLPQNKEPSEVENVSSLNQEQPRRLSPRQRRLIADYKSMTQQFANSYNIHIEESFGDIPEKYTICYNVKGIERLDGDEQPVIRNIHLVEIVLPGTYPRTPPLCRMLTPVFHPNIEPATICIGDFWTAAERLCDLVVRIGELIAYQDYNIKSPLDGEAARWADLNRDLLPIDSTDLRPEEF